MADPLFMMTAASREPGVSKMPRQGEEEPLRVLVVDDEPDLLRAYVRLLRRAGVVAEQASDGAQALERLSEGTFDAVLSDIHMPEMDGLSLLREVRERHGNLPFILVTGSPNVTSAVEAVEGGALHYLYKPVEPARLAELVRKAGAQRRTRAEDEVAAARLELEARFERALERLWIAYQPIVSLRDRRVIAFEALCRSREGTLPHPGAILAAAEELGRVCDLGRVVRARAIFGLEAMPPDCDLFINIHPDELNDDDLLDPSSPAMQHSSRIVLEVTERRALTGIDDLPARVAALKRAGYRLAVDDLGSGYAGLSSFASVEPEVVKLDMSLTRDIDRSPVKRRLVESMVALGRVLGGQVVVEGVETEAELQTLLEIGCDWMQGYYFGRPNPVPELPQL